MFPKYYIILDDDAIEFTAWKRSKKYVMWNWNGIENGYPWMNAIECNKVPNVASHRSFYFSILQNLSFKNNIFIV